MKNLLSTIMIISMYLLTSCGDDKNDTTSQRANPLKEVKSAVESKSKMKTYYEQVDEHKARLNNLKPVDPTELINWFPNKIDAMTKTKHEDQRNGFEQSTVVRTYYSNHAAGDNLKMFNVEVMDGAGPQSSSVVAGQIAQGKINVNQENDYGYQKHITHGNLNVHESYSKQYNSTNLTFAVNDRYGIMVKSHNMNSEELWSYVDKIDFSTLPK